MINKGSNKKKSTTILLIFFITLVLHNQRLSVTDPENTYPKRIRRAIRLFINPPNNDLEKHLTGKGIACKDSHYIYLKTAAATVLIESGGGVGAGVFIAPRVIATAGHVVDGRELTVFTSNTRDDSLAIPSKSIPAKLKHRFPSLDLAFVITSRNGPAWLDLEIETVLDTNLMIVGHPKRRYYSLQKARIKRKDLIGSSEYIFFKDNEVFFGNSGGAIVGCNGKLAGVVSMMNNYNNSMFKEGIGINARTILKYAKKLSLLQ